jgi:hypothetical protein
MAAINDATHAKPNAPWTPKAWLTPPAPPFPAATPSAKAELVQVKASVIVPSAADRPVKTYDEA